MSRPSDRPVRSDPKKLLYALPAVFAISGFNFPIGVLIYWTATNFWAVGQQLFIIRRNPTPGSIAERELNERRAAKACLLSVKPPKKLKACCRKTAKTQGPAPATCEKTEEETMNEEHTNTTEDVTDEEELEVTDIEAEGDHAADYIEELLDIADLDGDIDIEVRNNRTYLSVLAPEDDEDIQGLVGKNGKTLEALQELTRLAVLSSTGQRSRLILDIAGHRVQRADSLRELAREAIAKVESDGGQEH